MASTLKLGSRRGALALATALALAALLISAACGESGRVISQPQGTGTATAAAPTSGGTAGPTGKELTIDMKDNYYVQKDVTVAVNTTVTFLLKNEGTSIHNMHVPGEATGGQDAVSDLINPGSESKFQVKFVKTGTFRFVCDLHQPDMAGTVHVR